MELFFYLWVSFSAPVICRKVDNSEYRFRNLFSDSLSFFYKNQFQMRDKYLFNRNSPLFRYSSILTMELAQGKKKIISDLRSGRGIQVLGAQLESSEDYGFPLQNSINASLGSFLGISHGCSWHQHSITFRNSESQV